MKYICWATLVQVLPVSTLVVEWIEITLLFSHPAGPHVSTLVVEWIEIILNKSNIPTGHVSTLVVEWIEISLVLSRLSA